MQNSAQNAKWPYLRQKDAIKWFVGTVRSTSAINVIVQSLDMNISGEFPVCIFFLSYNAVLDKHNHIFFVYRGACVLFPQEEIDRWEMQMNQRVQRQVVAQAHAEMYVQHGQGHLCPTCRQPSPKVNNYFRCALTIFNYNYLCIMNPRRHLSCALTFQLWLLH
jgi:hypothetical protein